METRAAESANRLRVLVAGIVAGAKVIQGGGNDRSEPTLPERIREAATASLARMYFEFGDADDHRWRKAIERARAGAEHPLEVLDFDGKTEEHPVCSRVLSFVGSGKKGREVRSHFSSPPFGWPRDAIDGALISLFVGGHLRVSANGVPLIPPRLDQAKVPSADFRVESATIDTRQRLKLRKLFQDAGIDCKPNEEGAAASKLLELLRGLAVDAGGAAPLPERPDVRHLLDLQALAGNEQLLAILDKYDELESNLNDWTKAGAAAEARWPAFERLQALVRHANGLGAAVDTKPPDRCHCRRPTPACGVRPRAHPRQGSDVCVAD